MSEGDRVKSRRFNFLAAASLLLCAALVAAWGRSWLPEDFRWGVADGTAVLVFSRGRYTAMAEREYFSTAPQSEAPGGGHYPAGIGLRGFLDQLRRTGEAFPRATGPRANFATPLTPPPSKFRALGIVWVASADNEQVNDSRYQYWVAAVPLAWLLIPLAVPPAAWAARALRSRRRRGRNQCRECGYDLRASPGRCPECGAGAGAPDAIAAGMCDRPTAPSDGVTGGPAACTPTTPRTASRSLP
jgi:hypothetical protein